MTKTYPALRLAALSLCLLTLTGCAEYHKRILEDTPEKGPLFTRALAREYGALGQIEESDMYDYWSANYYFRKAICAKSGGCVAPTCLENWDLPENKIPELAAARCRLLRALGHGASRRAPLLTAHAQAQFDCWVEQQAEEWQHQDIMACRYGFYRTIAEVEFLLMGGPEKVMPHDHVFFGLNTAHLTIKALKHLQGVAKAAKGRHIILIGRTDRVGEAYHNRNLAHARALAVKRHLIRLGIAPHFITVKDSGPLPGPKVNAHDRRVDIIVLKD